MHEQINNYLNRSFPLFLSYRQGRIYFIGLIIILAFFLNVFQPFGLVNWHAPHKSLFLNGYSLTYIGTYGVIYFIYSWLRPDYFHRKSWTIRRELHILSLYIPVTALSCWTFTDLYIEEAEFSLDAFLELQLHNGIISIFTIPGFGYFVSTKLKRAKSTIVAAPPAIDTKIIDDITPDENPTPVISQAMPTLSPPAIIEPTGFILINKYNIDVSTILFAESRHNTLHLHLLRHGRVQELKKTMTLKAFAGLVVEYPYMKRCYASYIVNTDYIEWWSGSSAKMKLCLKGYHHTIPVSDTYTASFKELMNERGIVKKEGKS